VRGRRPPTGPRRRLQRPPRQARARALARREPRRRRDHPHPRRLDRGVVVWPVRASRQGRDDPEPAPARVRARLPRPGDRPHRLRRLDPRRQDAVARPDHHHLGLEVPGHLPRRPQDVPAPEDSTQKAMIRGDGGLGPCIPTGLIADALRVVDNEVRLEVGRHDHVPVVRASRRGDRPRQEHHARRATWSTRSRSSTTTATRSCSTRCKGRLSHPRAPAQGDRDLEPGAGGSLVLPPRRRPRDARRGLAFYVHTTLHDNAMNLDPRSTSPMLATEKTKPEWFDRYILGEWGAFGGKRFKCWNPEIHLIDPFPVPPEWEMSRRTTTAGATPGRACGARSTRGRRYVVYCHKESRSGRSATTREDQGAGRRLTCAVGGLARPVGLDFAGRVRIAGDGAHDYGIFAAKAQNDRLGGWNRIEEMLTDDLRRPRPRS
jgi:hypothetical protein